MTTTTVSVTRTSKGYVLTLPNGDTTTVGPNYTHAVVGFRPNDRFWVSRHKTAAAAAKSATNPSGADRVEIVTLEA